MSKVLSIEVGSRTTKIVEMDYQTKKPKVYRCFRINTPENAVKDGYINPDMIGELQGALKTLFKTKKIRTKKVLFTVFSGKIISREVVIPGVKQHQIAPLISTNVTEYFPIELDDYKISHILLNTIMDSDGTSKHKVLVVAAEKELLRGYEKLAELMGLYIVDIDYVGNSVYRAVRHSAGAEAVMAVKAEEENAQISILKEGKLIIQRNVNYSLGSYTQQDITSPEERMSSLMNAIIRVVDYYVNSEENNSISKIYILGDDLEEAVDNAASEENKSQIDALQTELDIKCKALVLVRGVTVTKRAEDADMSVFAAAIGAGMERIGFFREKEKERHETNYVTASVLIILFFIVLIAAILSLSIIPYNLAKSEEKELQRRMDSLAEAKLVYDKYVAVNDLWDQVKYGNWLTENSNDSILEFLAELEQKLPQDVEVTEFSSDDEQCIMYMKVADKEVAAGVINMLREFASLESVTVESIKEELPDESGDKLSKINAASNAAGDNDTDIVNNANETDNEGDNGAGADKEDGANAAPDTIVSFSVSCVYAHGSPLEQPKSGASGQEQETTEETLP